MEKIHQTKNRNLTNSYITIDMALTVHFPCSSAATGSRSRQPLIYLFIRLFVHLPDDLLSPANVVETFNIFNQYLSAYFSICVYLLIDKNK